MSETIEIETDKGKITANVFHRAGLFAVTDHAYWKSNNNFYYVTHIPTGLHTSLGFQSLTGATRHAEAMSKIITDPEMTQKQIALIPEARAELSRAQKDLGEQE